MIRSLLLFSCFTLLASAAPAQLNGGTLTADWRYPDFNSVLESHVITVGPGVELPNTTILNDTKFDIDLGNDTVEFRFNASSNWTNATYNGWHFADTTGTVPAITGYTIDSFSAGVTGTANIVAGFTADSFYADFGGMVVAGAGDWIRMKVTFGGPQISVTNVVAGQAATVSVTGATSNGMVGVGYSLAGPGPSTVNAGGCGSLSVCLSQPIRVLGVFPAVGTTMSTSVLVPAGATGVSVWFQGLDMASCTLTNCLALVVG